MENVENKANAVAENVSKNLSKITSISFKDFASSNSLISKVAFTILVMFIFFLLLKFSITLIPKLFKESNSPYIFNGTIEGSESVIIPQDPKYDNSVTIKRSVNENDGIEFSWSVWLFLDDSAIDNKGNSNTYIHIFHKGDYKSDVTNNINLIASPGLYLNKNENSLLVKMNIHPKPSNVKTSEEFDIKGIPMNKWFNVLIRVKNKLVDVYINGTIKRSIELENIPKQNYGNIYIAQKQEIQNYSLEGSKLSNLRYFDHALNVYEIQKIIQRGPNKKLVSNSAILDKSTSYLAFEWYYDMI